MQTGNAILVHDFPVLHEVLPDNPLLALADPNSVASARKALSNLLKAEFKSEMRTQLKDYANQFTYAARARQLLSWFALPPQGRSET